MYVAIVGTLLLAAFLEWFLWLAAFLYCLVKIYTKAEHYSIRILAVVMMIAFTLLRLVHSISHIFMLTLKHQSDFPSSNGRHFAASRTSEQVLSSFDG